MLLFSPVMVGCATSDLYVFTCHGCWVLAHSPRASWLTLAFTCHGWPCTHTHPSWLPLVSISPGCIQLTCHGGHWRSPVMADGALTYHGINAGIHLSWLTVHSPIMVLTLAFTCHGWRCTHLSWLALAFICHGWVCTHLSWFTLAFTYGWRCTHPSWFTLELTCPGLYAGIHGGGCTSLLWRTLVFTCHDKHWHSPVMADCVLLHLHLGCAARDEDIVSKS